MKCLPHLTSGLARSASALAALMLAGCISPAAPTPTPVSDATSTMPADPTGVLWIELTTASGERAVYLLDVSRHTLTKYMALKDNQHGSSLSPNGAQIALQEWDEGRYRQHIVVLNPATGQRKILAEGMDVVSAPVWSRDGAYLYVRTGPPINSDILRVNINTAETEYVVQSNYADGCPAPSLDGDYLAFTSDRGNNREVFVLSVADKEIYQLTNHLDTDSRCVSWSPTADTLALLTDAQGIMNISIASVPGGSTRQMTEFDSATTRLFPPVWSPDGNFIAYIVSEAGVYTVYVQDSENGERVKVVSVEELISINQWLSRPPELNS